MVPVHLPVWFNCSHSKVHDVSMLGMDTACFLLQADADANWFKAVFGTGFRGRVAPEPSNWSANDVNDQSGRESVPGGLYAHVENSAPSYFNKQVDKAAEIRLGARLHEVRIDR